MMEFQYIATDLKKRVKGEVQFDEVSRILYSTAACMYQIKPMGVVKPRDTEDVKAVLEYAYGHGIPITPRGVGSSLAGQAVGPGIILDFTKYMNQILQLDISNNQVRVQPGLIYEGLNRALKPYGKFFAPDPSSGKFCTIGGMVANNSAGGHSVKYGTTKDYVEKLRVVLSNGEVVDIQAVQLQNGHPRNPYRGESLARRAFDSIFELVQKNQKLIQNKTPRVSKNSSGYNLLEVVNDSSYDLNKLLVGSEGTLAVVTEVTVRILDLPKQRAAILAYFDTLDKAGQALVEVLGLKPAALEIMDHTFLNFARERDRRIDAMLPTNLEAALLIEYEGETPAEIRDKIEQTTTQLMQVSGLALGIEKAFDLENQERLWEVRKSAWSLINKVKGPEKPQNFIDDAAIDPAKIPDYLRGLHKIFDKYHVTAICFGHAGNGNIHVAPLLNLKTAEGVEKLKHLAQEAAALAIGLGGTISGEHGDGLARTPFLRQQFGELTDVFEQVKAIFDPQNIMNPGKIAGRVKYQIDENLRYGTKYQRKPTGSIFDRPDLLDEIEKCHGCGTCYSYCPMAIELKDEIAMARAKANLLRHLISGQCELDPQTFLLSKDFKRVIDTCFNCKLCLTECPTNVDIPRLAIEARSYYVEQKGQTLQNRILANARFSSQLSSLTAPISNLMLQFPLARKAMEQTVGIHHQRKFAKFYFHTLEKWAEKRNLAAEANQLPAVRKVVYFVGCFGNFNDVDGEGKSTIAVLEKNRVEVVVPRFKCCGVAKITLGNSDAVRKDAEQNLAILGHYVEQGYDVVTSAASCGLTIKQDYPKLLQTEMAKKVAQHTYDIHEYLMKLHAEGLLNTNFKPIKARVVYHHPCHLKAQGVESEPIQLLRMIPKLEVVEIEDSCCGMAGTFGFKKQNFDLSMNIGKRLFTNIHRAKPQIVTTGCGTCKIQIEQGIGQEVIHPMVLLRRAYGV